MVGIAPCISHGDDGGTLCLSGTHRLDAPDTADATPPGPDEDRGRGGRVANQVPDFEAALAQREQLRGPMGSVVHFSEALIHAGLAVLSETTRYAMFVDVTPSDIATGDVGRDQRRGYQPASVEEPWELSPGHDNPLVRMSKL